MACKKSKPPGIDVSAFQIRDPPAAYGQPYSPQDAAGKLLRDLDECGEDLEAYYEILDQVSCDSSQKIEPSPPLNFEDRLSSSLDKIKDYTERGNDCLSFTASKIANLIEAEYGDRGDHLKALAVVHDWVLCYARQISWEDSGTQNLLVDFLIALKSRLAPQPLDFTPPYPPSSWSTSGRFRYTVQCDQGFYHPGEVAQFNFKPQEQQNHEWININAFLARAAARYVDNVMPCGASLIHDTLNEKEAILDKFDERWVHFSTSETARLDTLLPPAAIWILLAGDKMLPKHHQVDSHIANTTQRACLESEDNQSLSSQRWDSWKVQFLNYALRSDLKAETRELMEKAFEKMNAIEKD